MKTYLILGAVVLVLLAGGGWYWMTTQNNEPAAPVYENTTPSGEAVTGSIDAVVAGETTQPAAGTYTMAQVMTHNSGTSCWAAVSGVVYDLTTWIKKHPGGTQAILSICGKDGTAAFTGKHMGDQKPEAMLATFKIGVVAQ